MSKSYEGYSIRQSHEDVKRAELYECRSAELYDNSSPKVNNDCDACGMFNYRYATLMILFSRK